jgi:polyphosphate kinase
MESNPHPAAAEGEAHSVSAASNAATGVSFEPGSLFINRELSLLAFQRRVLDEARDDANPLLERVNFLSILSSNLSEFFMVRVAVLKQRVASGSVELAVDGRSGQEQLDAIASEVARLEQAAYRCLGDDLIPALDRAGIRLVDYAALGQGERSVADAYFHDTVFPVLTPLAVDPARPFPHISNLSLNLAVLVKTPQGATHFARVKVPPTLPQLVALASPAGQGTTFVWLEQLIAANLASLFRGMEIVEAHPFHVTRDAEVAIQELESDDLLETIEEAVWRRRFRAVVRLQAPENIPEEILSILAENLRVPLKDVYRAAGPLDLSRLRELHSLERPELKYRPFSPHTPLELRPHAKEDIFALIRRDDLLLHHPFESFEPVVEFINQAAHDPDVLAIKMTLYRVGRNSPIVKALLAATEEGKQVSVLLELKARFDEESNIEWARSLEREGVHVVYGLVGLKVHSKIAMVVRREGDLIRRYVHLGTGNYNPATARLYTDLSVFTCDEEVGADASELFNRLTGYSAADTFIKLLVAPVNMQPRLEHAIRREIDFARSGEPAHLIFKTNALEDPAMVKLLYEASQAGVQIDLLVRGICCLRPGAPGVSENIRVTSIIGRFLEHSRIYYFHNGGREEIYIGSADLMPRNLYHRIELLYPVSSGRLRRRLHDGVLRGYLSDTANARRMRSDGEYEWTPRSGREPGPDSHARFIAHYAGRESAPHRGRTSAND